MADCRVSYMMHTRMQIFFPLNVSALWLRLDPKRMSVCVNGIQYNTIQYDTIQYSTTCFSLAIFCGPDRKILFCLPRGQVIFGSQLEPRANVLGNRSDKSKETANPCIPTDAAAEFLPRVSRQTSVLHAAFLFSVACRVWWLWVN